MDVVLLRIVSEDYGLIEERSTTKINELCYKRGVFYYLIYRDFEVRDLIDGFQHYQVDDLLDLKLKTSFPSGNLNLDQPCSRVLKQLVQHGEELVCSTELVCLGNCTSMLRFPVWFSSGRLNDGSLFGMSMADAGEVSLITISLFGLRVSLGLVDFFV